MLTPAQILWMNVVLGVAPAAQDDGADTDDENAQQDLSAKASFRQRLQQMQASLQTVDDGITDGSFKGAGPQVLAAVKAYNSARKAVTTAETKKRYSSGNEALGRLEVALRDLSGAAGGRLARDATENQSYEDRKKYLTRFPLVTDDFSAVIARGQAAFPGPLATAWTDFMAANGARSGAVMQRNYGRGWAELVNQEAAMALLTPPPTALLGAQRRHDQLEAQGNKLVAGIDGGSYSGLDTESQQFKADYTPALGQAAQALTNTDAPDAAAAEGHLDTVQTAIETFRAAVAGSLGAVATQDKSKALKRAKDCLAQDPNALRVLMAQPGGGDALDAMMKAMGKSAKSDADKTFVTAAILARYNMTSLSGNLTTKALPAFYQVLGDVPAGLTFGNDKLQHIKRDRGSQQASTYGDLTLTLNIGKTGESGHHIDQDPNVDANARLKDKKLKTFNHTTLHELGHSVDDDQTFMDTHGNADAYGGWRLHSIDEIADVAGQQKGFYDQYASNGLSEDYLRELLKATLGGRAWNTPTGDMKELQLGDRVVTAKPQPSELLSHAAIKQAQTDVERLREEPGGWDEALANTLLQDLRRSVQITDAHFKLVYAVLDKMRTDRLDASKAIKQLLAQLVVKAPTDAPIDLDAMKGHAAVQWCDAIRMGGGDEVWQKFKGDPAFYTVGARVYYQDRNNWRSYAVAARKKGVSQYQFKASPEWFAELFAAFQMGVLPGSHPDHAWMAAEFGPAAAN